MNRMIPLWPGAIPYAEGYPEQIPAMKEFRIPESRSAMLVCPGGGYTMKAEIEGDPVAEMVNAIGVSAYVLAYRILPCSRYAPMTDALRALRLLRSMGYEKVGIMGFSAGGHISAMVATANTDGAPEANDPIERLSARPDAFALCYTPVDLIHYDQKGSRRNLLGTLSDDPKPVAAKPAAKPAAAGSVTVNAPMPGNINAVRVTVGQTVKKGDDLVILEAMKMENEIKAPSDGTVASVNVTKGATVNTGDVLVTLN